MDCLDSEASFCRQDPPNNCLNYGTAYVIYLFEGSAKEIYRF
jgi:hypothetical protein